MDEIEIQAFEADTRASKGLTAAHIAAAAEAYNGETNPAPLVFGHPAADSPALGVISGARAEGSKLFLKIKNIAQQVVDGVKERRILNRSIAFWAPDHPSNPSPGVYAIRHLGLLGGQAPAIPGMPAMRFSADDAELESDGGEGPADAIVYSVEPPAAPTGLQEIREPAPSKEPTMTEEEINAARTANEAEATRLANERTALETSQREFAASAQTARESANKATVDAAVSAGKVLPAEAADLAAIFNALPTTAMTFSAGELEPRQALASFLDKLPKRTPIGDGQRTPAVEFNADDGKAKAEKALADANKNLATAYKE